MQSLSEALASTATATATSLKSKVCGGGCSNGICVVDKCFCDAGYSGNDCSTVSPVTQSCSMEPTLDDSCMNSNEGYGRLMAFSRERVHMAATCELEFWTTTAVPHRNSAQVTTMRKFADVPRFLGHVLELGAGPYTKTRLMLQEGSVSRTMDDVTSVTLEGEEHKTTFLSPYTNSTHVHTCRPPANVLPERRQGTKL